MTNDGAPTPAPTPAPRIDRRAQSALRLTESRLARWAPLFAAVLLATIPVSLWLHRDAVGPALGGDWRYFVGIADRWWQTGTPYLPTQLAGPYVATVGTNTPDTPVIYPPIALVLFVPLLLLPALAWWAIPLGIIGYVVWRLRPASLAWPIIALCLAWPRSQQLLIEGSTTMWITAFAALGLVRPGAAVLVLMKPSFAPLALIGANRATWWVAAAALVVVSAAMLPLWWDYLAVWRNAGSSWPGPLYSLPDLPFVAIPFIAWATSRNHVRRSS